MTLKFKYKICIIFLCKFHLHKNKQITAGNFMLDPVFHPHDLISSSEQAQKTEVYCPILLMRKLRLREVISLAQGLIACALLVAEQRTCSLHGSCLRIAQKFFRVE